MSQMELFGDSQMFCGARFSPCRTWRYQLWRRWSSARSLMVVGLNPSTADEWQDDPTIRRCINFARDWGFGCLVMANAYAYRSTDPKGLWSVDDPVGPENDDALQSLAQMAGMVLVAWGVNCKPERQEQVLELLDRPVHCLGTTKEGFPKHPLYIARSQKPVEFLV